MRYYYLKPLRKNQAVVTVDLTATPTSLTLDRTSPGNVASFVVSLNQQSASPVLVSVSSSDPSVTLSPSSFTLGAAGQISQSVTVTGAATGPDAVSLQVTAPGMTTQTIAISRPSVPLSLSVTPTSLTLDRVSPGNVGSFTAALNRVPESPVLVSISSSDASVGVFPASFSLSAGNPPSSSVTLTGSVSGPSPITISVNPLGLPSQTVTVARGPFTPNMISGLSLWLDASDASSITLDGSNNVSQWSDLSGNGRHATQATAGNRPTVSTATPTGLRAVRFEQKFLSHTLTYTLGSLFVVWEHPTTFSGSYNGICGYRNGGGSDLEMSLLLPAAPGGPPPTRVWELYNAAETSTVIRFNGVQRPAAENEATNGSPARVSPNRWNILSATFPAKTGTKALYLGAEAFAPASRLMQNGHIAEVIGYAAPLSAANVATVEAYLAARWGIAQ